MYYFSTRWAEGQWNQVGEDVREEPTIWGQLDSQMYLGLISFCLAVIVSLSPTQMHFLEELLIAFPTVDGVPVNEDLI